jgi:hypothetical protein
MMLEEEGIEHIVLCHTEEQKRLYIEHGRVKANRIIATGKPKGLAFNRNVALDMMEIGEWAIFLVDDLISISELNNYDRAKSPLPITMENQYVYRERFRTPITLNHFVERAKSFTKVCERNRCNLGGWAGIDNSIYRTSKYKTNVLADGRAWIVRKTTLRFDQNVNAMDDYCWTALNIKHFGIVIIDQWILENYGKLPDSEKFEIMKTFELYWDEFNFPYAEIKTLKQYPPPPFFPN